MASLPENFGSRLKSLQNYAKQTVKIYPDRTGVIGHGDTFSIILPKNTLVDLRSLVMYFQGTAVGNGYRTVATVNQYQSRFFPRNTASIIDTLSVSINGQRICTISEYGHLYNILWDYMCSLENNHSGKRALENTDPSFKTSMADDGTIIKLRNARTATADISDNKRDFCITNWLGFLGTSSSEIIDTGILGEVRIEIRLAPPSILWKSGKPDDTNDANTNTASRSYSLDNTFFTINRITFNNPEFYELQSAMLNSEGIPIAFKTYTNHKGSTTDSAIAHSFNVNSQRLNKLIGTCIPSDYTTENYLLLSGSDAGTTATTQLECLVDGEATQMFNQSAYFRKNGLHVATSQFEVNNVATSPAPLTVKEIFNHNMDAFNLTLDMNGGIHSGAYDLNAWKKDYFTHIVPFEHRNGQTSDFYIEGLDGRSAALSVKWTTTRNSNTDEVIPIVFAEMTKLLTVNAGQQLSMQY